MYNPLDLLPTLISYYESLCIKISTRKWHYPGFFLSSGLLFPLSLYLFKLKTKYTFLNIVKDIVVNLLIVIGTIFFLKGFFIFLFLLPIARIVKFLYAKFTLNKPITEKIEIPEERTRKKFELTGLDKLAIVFILFIGVSFLINSSKLYPVGDDAWYHLAVSRNIIELGKIPMWDTWEFQPFGRPHLYPPLLHLMIAFFSGEPDRVIEGARVLQVFLYSISLFLYWYFFRMLFSSKIALIALVFLSMDFTFFLIYLGLMPSALVNLFLPLLLISFLLKKLKTSVFLMVLCLYSHLSFPFLILVCLFIVSYKYRSYLSFYKKFALISLVLYIPWAIRVFFFRDFLRSFATITGNPVLGLLIGMLSLQILNPVFLYLGYKGIKNSSGDNRDLIKYILIGFLPALIFYGGRYWFHAAPFWCIMIALYLQRFFNTRKMIAVLLIISLIPMPLIAIGVPNVKSPLLPGITAMDQAILLYGPSDKLIEIQNDQKLKNYILENVPEEKVIHVDEPTLADRVVVLTGRKVDNGMWFEVGNEEIRKGIEIIRLTEKNAYFVYKNKDKLPPVDKIFQIGDYWIGIRD